uniref:Uncharacterized protein n=1 Tax=Cacopsylla melanoneura TaxID=428564 RepID=A0A8D8Y8J9_9HEMI
MLNNNNKNHFEYSLKKITRSSRNLRVSALDRVIFPSQNIKWKKNRPLSLPSNFRIVGDILFCDVNKKVLLSYSISIIYSSLFEVMLPDTSAQQSSYFLSVRTYCTHYQYQVES